MGKLKLNNGLVVIAVLLFANTGYSDADSAAVSSTGTSGIYSGESTFYRYPGPVQSTPKSMIGAVKEDGKGYFISVHAASSEIQLFQNLQGSNKVTSPGREVPTEGQAVSRGAQNWQFEIKPVDSSGNAYALHGTFNCGDCFISLNLSMLPLTHQKVSLTSRGGSYHGVDINRLTKVTATIDSGGRLMGTDSLGCRISGTLTQVGVLNLFDALISFTGTSACHGAMRGVAFFDSQDRTGQISAATGHYLYMIGTNTDFNHGFAMVLTYPRR